MANNCKHTKPGCGCVDGPMTTPPACPPLPCDNSQPCSSYTDAECVIYTGDDIICNEQVIAEQNQPVNQIIQNIIDLACVDDTVQVDQYFIRTDDESWFFDSLGYTVLLWQANFNNSRTLSIDNFSRFRRLKIFIVNPNGGAYDINIESREGTTGPYTPAKIITSTGELTSTIDIGGFNPKGLSINLFAFYEPTVPTYGPTGNVIGDDLIINDSSGAITFTKKTIFGTFLLPVPTLTSSLSGSRLGIVQKIYSQAAVFTPPVGWVLIGSVTWDAVGLNIIYAEWVGGTRVEYKIEQPN